MQCFPSCYEFISSSASCRISKHDKIDAVASSENRYIQETCVHVLNSKLVSSFQKIWLMVLAALLYESPTTDDQQTNRDVQSYF